jgi:hypothetical protein
MKVKPEHYEKLKAAIDKIDREKAARHKALGLGNDKDMRFRWDVMWAIPYKIRRDIIDELYEYCNDEHIDTALKKIVKELGL